MAQQRPTQRQAEVLAFIRDHIQWHGYAPSLREISTHLGINGPQNARKHIDALEKKGYIKRTAKLARGIEIMGEPAEISSVPPQKIPIVGDVRAGLPELAIEDIQGHTFIDPAIFNCRSSSEHFILKIKGSSMTEASIDDGDFILIRQQSTAINRDIVVAMVEGEATVKRFFKHGDYVLLQPENSSMRAITVRDGEFSIIGKVISVIKNIG